jgi:Flp pilus assembly protein TadG
MFATIFAVFVLMLAGLLVDGGLMIHARERAADIAEQAARAAADDVDVAYLRQTGKARIVTSSDEPCRRARRLAATYKEVTGPIDCQADAQVARVTVHIKVKFQLLGGLGIPDEPMDSTAFARPQEGI